MPAMLLLIFFVGCGTLISRRIFRNEDALIQMVASLVLGLTGLMWGPIPFAFFFGFSSVAHYGAVWLMAGVTSLIIYITNKPPQVQLKGSLRPDALIFTIAGLALVMWLLLFLHVLRPGGGNLYAGPSTYGDLAMHLGIITNLVEQGAFPPEYSIFPGVRLAYPFLVNSLSASLNLLGLPLRWAILVPSFLLAFIVAGSFVLLARDVLKKRLAVSLAAIMFFLSGGLGFIYFLPGMSHDPHPFTRLFRGYYFTPTNIGEHNIYMWNVICHVLVPQRSALAGWGMLFFALWLLYRGIRRQERKHFILSGVFAGLMPMVHTASFFVFIGMAMPWFVVHLFTVDNKAQYAKLWLLLALPLVVLSMPQLLFWTFGMVRQERFVRFHFNWANKNDFWLWFWIKNAGFVFLLSPVALFYASRKRVRFYSAAIVIFIMADLFVFSPYAPNNNKVFHIWYAFSAILVAGFLNDCYLRFKNFKARGVILALVVFVCIFSGLLTVAHGFVKLPKLFSAADIATAAFIKQHTPQDALFVSSDFHNNPITCLAGRKTLCGYHGWLYSIGIDYGQRAQDIKKMYLTPQKTLPYIQKKYAIDYVYVSSHERHQYAQADAGYFYDKFPLIFIKDDIKIYAVSKRAIQKFETRGEP